MASEYEADMPEDGEGLYRAMGRVEGRLSSLDAAVREDRVRFAANYERIIARLEVMDAHITEVTEKSQSMQTQIYSNKHGIEGVNKDLGTLKTVYTKGLGAIAVLGFFGAMMLAGVWWALTHWNEMGEAIKALGKP